MGHNFKNFKAFVLGDPDQFEMEGRLFNVVLVFIFLAGLMNAITEFYLNLPPKFYFFAFLVAVVAGIFYGYNRLYNKHRVLVWPLMMLGYVIVGYDWYLSGGLSGVSLHMALAFIAIIPVFMRKKQTYISFCIMIAFVSILFFIEFYEPQLLNYYATKDLELQDIISTFIAISFFLVLAISTIVKSYRTEHEKVMQGNIQLQKANMALEESNDELKKALNDIDELSGLLPICASCKKIRDDNGYWNQIESYIQKHSAAKFSHSMCPECSDKFYGHEDWYIKMKKDPNGK